MWLDCLKERNREGFRNDELFKPFHSETESVHGSLQPLLRIKKVMCDDDIHTQESNSALPVNPSLFTICAIMATSVVA